jgi:hypothetical protein
MSKMLTISRVVCLLGLLCFVVGCGTKPEAQTDEDQARLAAASQAEDEARQIGAAATLLGVTLYPNSKPSETREAYQFRENIDGRRYWLLMTTKDSIESVIAHFKSTAGLMERRTGTKVQLEGRTPAGASITIDFGKDGLGQTEYMLIGTLSNTTLSAPDVTGTAQPTNIEEPLPVPPAPPTESAPIGGSGRVEPDYEEPSEGETPPEYPAEAPPGEGAPAPPGEGN